MKRKIIAAILATLSAVCVWQTFADGRNMPDSDECIRDCQIEYQDCIPHNPDVAPCKRQLGECLKRCSARRYGEWGKAFDWPNVAIHAHVLPSGKVLFWSRREWSGAKPAEGLDPRDCTPRLWDPATNTFVNLARPGYNLFCSGHTILPDGRLLVTGGHVRDGEGEKHAALYDPNTNAWTRLSDMNAGRWYPTVVTLANGGVLVFAGAVAWGQPDNSVPQVWEGDKWRTVAEFPEVSPLYPRMHVAPDGRVFMSGPLQTSWFLDTNGSGSWTKVAASAGRYRDFGCSVMYDKGKVIIIGGGDPPQNTAETIDLNQLVPVWQPTGSMLEARRQQNATILPDGKILVTGGTSGNGFNDLSKPVTAAELWDPNTGQWTSMAGEAISRMYHSIAVLLPDGRVLSAGGGEYKPSDSNENKPEDSHRDAQVFSPPYLFQGARPEIANAPKDVSYGKQFTVEISDASKIGEVTLVRLSSVTHAFNQDQRIIKNLTFTSDGANKLQIIAPDSPNTCPPGHYMLFVLNQLKVPSVANIIKIQ